MGPNVMAKGEQATQYGQDRVLIKANQ